MKSRILCLVGAVVLALTMAACGGSLRVGDASEYVTDTEPLAGMTVTEATPTSAVYRVSNETGYEIYTGNENAIELEVEWDGAWHCIEIGDWSTTAEALIMEDGAVREMKATWENTYEALPKGHYRLLKGFQTEDVAADGFILSAEFDIE